MTFVRGQSNRHPNSVKRSLDEIMHSEDEIIDDIYMMLFPAVLSLVALLLAIATSRAGQAWDEATRPDKEQENLGQQPAPDEERVVVQPIGDAPVGVAEVHRPNEAVPVARRVWLVRAAA
tara:strand:+ start:11404 stop:11763 length:360 start_codon:yes stop_codon:yes gene_type:complete